MTDKKITDLTALGAAPAVGDYFEMVDVSDTTENAAGSSFKITHANLVDGLLANVSEDTSPSLGGDLDANGNNIDMNTNNIIDIQLAEFAAEYDDGNSSTADTIVWGNGNNHKSTLTGNVTYTFTAPSGPARLQLKLIQDGTGSRTATWPTMFWTGGTAPTLSTAAASVDIVTIWYDGTNYYGTVVLDLQ